jgi:hypothetical protein
MIETGSKEKQAKRIHTIKKCPECFTVLGLYATECFNCGQKVEEPDERGIAKKPVDYKAYSKAILSWGALFAFIWIMGWSDLFKRAGRWMKDWIVTIVVGIWDWIVDMIMFLWGWVTGG